MAKKKKKHKPKLKLIKTTPEETTDNPPKPTIEDIDHAVDEVILSEDLIPDESLLRAFIRQDLKNICVNQQSEKEEFEIVVDTSSSEILYDVRPIEDFMVRSPNLEAKDCVWIVSVQIVDKNLNNPYTMLVLTDNQEGALCVCQGEIKRLFEPYPVGKKEITILVKKEFVQLNENARINVKIDFIFEELGVAYRVSSGILFTSD